MPLLYSYRKVRRKGRKDGRNWYYKFPLLMRGEKAPYPALDQQSPAQFEEELCRKADGEIAGIAEQWDTEDEKLFTRYCKNLTIRNNLRADHKEDRQEVAAAKSQLEKAAAALEEIEQPSISSKFEIAFLIFLFIVEIPFNAVIFSLFGVELWESIIMATGTAAVISVSAYGFGLKLKIHPKTLTDKLLIIVIPVLITGALLSISILRAKLFEAAQEKAILKINLTPDTAAIIFVAINFILFMAAFLVTYAATRPNHKFWRTKRNIFREARKAYRNALKSSEETWEELADAEENVITSKSHRSKRHEVYCEEARTIAESAQWLSQVYRRANMETRHDSIEPACFQIPPRTIDIPVSLREGNITWDCQQLQHEIPILSKN